MIIETIKNYIHALQDKVIMRQYTTTVDKNNKRSLEIVEFSYTPYSVKGKLEESDTKGSKIDIKA